MFGSLTNFESLFDELRRWEQEVDQMLGFGGSPAGIRAVARGTFPGVNVGATDESVDVYLFAPGLDPNKLELTLQQNLLLVSGERAEPVNEKAAYYRQERFRGEFRRVVSLPDDVDPDNVSAKYRDGILQVSVRRRQAVKPRQITVN